MWDRPGDSPVDQAWSKPKDNLARAIVEVKHKVTRELKPFVVCAGEDFCNFQWIYIASVPGVVRGNVTPITSIVGLKLVTRDKKIYVLNNGKVFIEERTEEDKNFHYAGYGK